MKSDEIQEKWSEICFLLSENIKAEISEKDFENQVIRTSENLGWREFRSEIQRQPIIQMGRKGNIRPDIVIYGPNKKAQIVLEVKRPSENLSKDESTSQLISYMRQVKADFGLLVGKQIWMYYDGSLNPQQEPLLLDKISFDKKSNKGTRFVKIFNKNDFLNNNYESYLIKLIEQFKAKRNINKLKEILSADKTRRKIYQFLKEEYAEYGSDVVDEALKDLIIELSVGDGDEKRKEQHEKTVIDTGKQKEPIGIREQVFNCIKSHRKGISVTEIIERTGFGTKQVSNAIHRLSKKGRIQSVGRGIYVVV